MKTGYLVLTLFFYATVLVVVHLIHNKYFEVDVVFYSAMLDSGIALVITSAGLLLFKLFRVYSEFEKFLIVLVLFFSGYSFSISVPTVIDRSLSLYILEKIDQRGGGIRLSEMEWVFKNEYMVEHRLVDIRLTEQLKSGTISIDDDCVVLTGKGKVIAAFSRFYRTNLLPKKRLLRGEYIDDLTDPFRSSVSSPGYECNSDDQT